MSLVFLYPPMGEGGHNAPVAAPPSWRWRRRAGPTDGATVDITRPRVATFPKPCAPQGLDPKVGHALRSLPSYIVIGLFPINEIKLLSCVIPFCSET